MVRVLVVRLTPRTSISIHTPLTTRCRLERITSPTIQPSLIMVTTMAEELVSRPFRDAL